MKTILKIILIITAIIFLAGQKNGYSQYNLGGSVWFDNPLVTYDPDAQAVFDAFSAPPSYEDKANINMLILALKSAGVWDKLDVLWVTAAGTQQAGTINWKNPGTHTLTLVDNPVFTQYEGFTGNGTDSYFNTNWNPTDDGSAYTLDDAGFSVYLRKDVAATPNWVFGFVDSKNFNLIFQSLRTGNQVLSWINSGNSYSEPNTESYGFYQASRISSTEIEIFKDGISLGIDISSSAGLPSGGDIYGLAYNAFNIGVPFGFSINQISYLGFGSSLNSTQASTEKEAIEQYMDAYGKGVIP